MIRKQTATKRGSITVTPNPEDGALCAEGSGVATGSEGQRKTTNDRSVDFQPSRTLPIKAHFSVGLVR